MPIVNVLLGTRVDLLVSRARPFGLVCAVQISAKLAKLSRTAAELSEVVMLLHFFPFYYGRPCESAGGGQVEGGGAVMPQYVA